MTLETPSQPVLVTASQPTLAVTPVALQSKNLAPLPTPITPLVMDEQQESCDADINVGDDDHHLSPRDRVNAGEDESSDVGERAAFPTGNPSPLPEFSNWAELGLKGVSEAIRLSLEDQNTIWEAISNAPGSDKFAHQVASLFRVILDGEQRENKEPGQFGFNISKERVVSRQDILSLYYHEGLPNAAWYTDTIINTVLDLEANTFQDVHVERNLGHFLLEDYANLLDSEIANAQRGHEPFMGWPFADFSAQHSRILATINPSGNHWVTVEVVLNANECRSPELLYYNSLSEAKGRGPTFKAATDTLPKLLYLASFRHGSPLAGFNPHTLEVKEVECPQQVGCWDCGPFSLHFFYRRLHNYTISGQSLAEAQRCKFGQQLRKTCANLLYKAYYKTVQPALSREIPDSESCEEVIEEQQALSDATSGPPCPAGSSADSIEFGAIPPTVNGHGSKGRMLPIR